ncbi:MAG: sigma-54-dependent Fis family transcriptional regulator, partial [Candidatus Tectomicrobia bacterium]|nr:sigma-54-dependent Fis family transcriptional regulator [Candidatus Tectomicrobia bacterium]
MAFLNSSERAFLQKVADVAYCNPFLPERIACERAALGPDFVESEALWNMRGDDRDTPHVNSLKIAERVA